MSTGTSIEWTAADDGSKGATWNPVSGCTRVSAGCDHCYAVRQTHRLEAMGQAKYAGLTVLNPKGDRHFNGVVRCHEEALEIPLRWRKPRRIFVNSMSDLFHESVPFEFVAAVYGIAAACPAHTFQILTKRPERAAEFYRWLADRVRVGNTRETAVEDPIAACVGFASRAMGEKMRPDHALLLHVEQVGPLERRRKRWPLQNVWLGTSVENQATADERIPHLLKCPAAVRFLSCEPLLGWIDLIRTLATEDVDEDVWREAHEWAGECELCGGEGVREYQDSPDEWGEDCPSEVNHLISCRGCAERDRAVLARVAGRAGIGWVIVGGESGKGARPCDVEWIRSIVEQCKASGVPVFVKQMGKPVRWDEQDADRDPFAWLSCSQCAWIGQWHEANKRGNVDAEGRYCCPECRSAGCVETTLLSNAITDPKGGDPAEWPADLRVREMPGEKVTK